MFLNSNLSNSNFSSLPPPLEIRIRETFHSWNLSLIRTEILPLAIQIRDRQLYFPIIKKSLGILLLEHLTEWIKIWLKILCMECRFSFGNQTGCTRSQNSISTHKAKIMANSFKTLLWFIYESQKRLTKVRSLPKTYYYQILPEIHLKTLPHLRGISTVVNDFITD